MRKPPARNVKYKATIKDWPEGDRPREKLLQRGADALTEAELLAIFIRTGIRGSTAVDIAKRILGEKESLRSVGNMSPAEFKKHGLGPARSAAILAAFELAKRIPLKDGNAKPVLRTPDEVFQRYGQKFRDLKHEEFWALLLNSANRIIAEKKVTSGTLNSSLVHPRECFQWAIAESAASVIFIHNHPSGNPEPSSEDVAVTKQLVESGKILGIPVNDHIIIAGNSFTSFAEQGLL